MKAKWQDMQKDFPSSELKPLSVLDKLWKGGHYSLWGMYQGNKLCAYACLFQPTPESMVLLDYFAVCSDQRGTGIGSIFLPRLLNAYANTPGMLLEVEDPVFSTSPAEKELRIRRIRFYLRAGIVETPLRAQVYGVAYRILAWTPQKSMSSQDLLTHLDTVYKALFSSLPNAPVLLSMED